MARKLKSDRLLFTATIVLVAVGVLMVYSASVMTATELYQQPYQFLVKQALWGMLGIGLLAMVMSVNYRHYREPPFIWACLAIVGMALVAVLFSAPINGARRWFSVGGFGIQPSEMAKLAAIFFVAAILERRMHRINEIRYSLAPIGCIVGALVVLILLERDFGTPAALVLIAASMVFAAGLSWVYIAASAALATPAVAVLIVMNPERMQRVLSFLDPWKDRQDSSYQVVQSMIAIGSGGMTGRGFTQGVQKLHYLPEAHTDFIYSVIGEELGLLGTTAVLVCFVIIAWRGLRIAQHAEDAFGSLLAIGITTMIAAQAFVNMSVTMSLLPTKGIPLPFISYGGSSFLVSMVAMGVLLNVSQHTTTK
jgi:cell division protein FtsW